jgi:hypothetical protein
VFGITQLIEGRGCVWGLWGGRILLPGVGVIRCDYADRAVNRYHADSAENRYYADISVNRYYADGAVNRYYTDKAVN